MNTTNKNIKFKLQKKFFSENFTNYIINSLIKKKIKYIFNKSDIKNKLLNIKDKIDKDLLVLSSKKK